MAKNISQNSTDPGTNNANAIAPRVANFSGLQLLQKISTTSGTAVQFTNFANYSYSNYLITMSNLTTTSAGQTVQLQGSINNGVSYQTTGAGSVNNELLGGSISGTSTASGFLITTTYGGNTSLISGQIEIYGMNTNNVTAFCKYYVGSPAVLTLIEAAGFWAAGAPVNALQYANNGFTFLSGTLSLYGLPG